MGKVSSWISPDSQDAAAASRSCAALSQELSWAAFLGLQAVLVPGPKQLGAAFNYGQVINQVCDNGVRNLISHPGCDAVVTGVKGGGGIVYRDQ